MCEPALRALHGVSSPAAAAAAASQRPLSPFAQQPALAPQELLPLARITVDLGESSTCRFVEEYGESMMVGELAEPQGPEGGRRLAGHYWGFAVRLARSLSKVWDDCPHKGGYDLAIGTVEGAHAAFREAQHARACLCSRPPLVSGKPT